MSWIQVQFWVPDIMFLFGRIFLESEDKADANTDKVNVLKILKNIYSIFIFVFFPSYSPVVNSSPLKGLTFF